MNLPNNTSHRSTSKAWGIWISLMLFVGIFIFRPIFGLLLGLLFGMGALALLTSIFKAILSGTDEKPDDYAELADTKMPSTDPIQHQKDLANVRYLASEHYRQENPVNSLGQVVVAMVICVGILILLAMLGSHFITGGVVLGVVLMIFATVGIWSKDVTEWQYEDERINPEMSADAIEESLRNDGIQETFWRTHHWSE